MDLMLVTDYIPAAARGDPSDRRARRAGKARRPLAGADGPRPRARSTCSARRATSRPPATRPSCETEADAVGPRHADRPAAGPSSQQRIAALPPSTFAPFDPPVVSRGRDRPLPALARRPRTTALTAAAAAVSHDARR